MVDHSRIQSLYGEMHEENDTNEANDTIKRKCEFDADDSSNSKTFRNIASEKKPNTAKESLNDKDIMVKILLPPSHRMFYACFMHRMLNAIDR